jgi:hypothetical protein
MSDIFLSYKSEDIDRAKIFVDALGQHGYSVWWDRTIPPGKTFEDVIKKAMSLAKCMIVLSSSRSVLSDYVKEEAEEGKRKDILIPVLIDDVEIQYGFKRIQSARLINWNGTLPDTEFDKLLNSISEIVGHASLSDMENSKQPIPEIKELKKSKEERNEIKHGIDSKGQGKDILPNDYIPSGI